MKEAVIVAAVRTPLGAFGGRFGKFSYQERYRKSELETRTS